MKYRVEKGAPDNWIVGGGEQGAVFAGPNAEQYAREHAERLNKEEAERRPWSYDECDRDCPAEPWRISRMSNDRLKVVGGCKNVTVSASRIYNEKIHDYLCRILNDAHERGDKMPGVE